MSIGWWCYLTISSFAAPFSFFLHSFLASRSLPMNPLAHKGCKIVILICTRHRHWLKFLMDIIPLHVLPHEVGSISNPSSREKGLPWWLNGKESVCQRRRHQFDPWIRKIPWGEHGNPLQHSSLENPMDRGAWWAIQSIGLKRVRHDGSNWAGTQVREKRWGHRG